MLYVGMGKKRTPTELVPAEIADDAYGAVLADISDLLESARRAAARSVNAIMTASYWAVGRRIVEDEQRGQRRADYGERLVTRLAEDLTRRFGRGFGYRQPLSDEEILPDMPTREFCRHRLQNPGGPRHPANRPPPKRC